MNSKKKINIATILPYKENYSLEKASAASLWVSEFFKDSKFKNSNFIFGNTNSKNYLTKNYININLKSLNVTHDTEPNIPSSFSKLEQLVTLSFRNSQFEKIPSVFNDLIKINHLDVWDNYIDEIEPELLARLNQYCVRNLDLEGNVVANSASKIKKYKSLLPYAYISK